VSLWLLLVAGAIGVLLATKAGAVTFTPAAPLDFGAVSVGATGGPQSVTLATTPSPGGPATVITNVALVPGSPFTITGTNCNATPPPSTCNVTVTFSPVGAGPASGTLQGTEVNPATGASTSFTYQLTGTGTAPPPVLPEAPDPRLLPLIAVALFGASFWILRRRATAATPETHTR
jgi:hypothetical protein